MRVAIAGYGIEGEANYKYWSNLGHEITIFDEKTPSRSMPSGVRSVIGPNAFSEMDDYDLVVRTAGLAPNKIKTNGKIWSATNEFFEKCKAEIIGVTGTKGKGTTCSLIAEILRASGKTVHLVGNIGVPALEVLSNIKDDDIVVFELSSFQLWDLHKSPHIATVLMVEPDHMDIHASMDEYIEAKANITRHQNVSDVVVFHPVNKYSAKIASCSPGQKIKFMDPSSVYIENDKIYAYGEMICKKDEVALIGSHNLENVCAAIASAWPYTNGIAAIKTAVTSFRGLPHRLEFVREVGGVKYYNDSFSSAPGATIAAIRSFLEPQVLICGGFDRGLNYKELTEAIVDCGKIKTILLIGQTAEAIAAELRRLSFTGKYQVLENVGMNDIVRKAAAESESGDVVLLSPGCASFDMFSDFYDRGNQFKDAVGRLDNK